MKKKSADFVRVNAYSRLHFGLANLSSSGSRVNGGVGAMIGPSYLSVEARETAKPMLCSTDFSKEIEIICNQLGVESNLQLKIEIHRNMKWHYGMGFHTQLRMAIAAAILLHKKVKINPTLLASTLSRGGTSGIGSLGFWHGGILFDKGHKREKKINEVHLPSSAITTPKTSPLLSWKKELPFFPVVVHAKNWDLIFGEREKELFRKITPIPEAEAITSSRIIFSELRSAVLEPDFQAFCNAIESIGEIGFKRREIEFRGEKAQQLKSILRLAGLQGIGMSSWGPTWYGFTSQKTDAERAVAILSKNQEVEAAWIAYFAPGAAVELNDGTCNSALSIFQNALDS